MHIIYTLLTGLGFFLSHPTLVAAATDPIASGQGHNLSLTFLYIAILLIIAKSAGIIEKLGQPSVLGELTAGIILSAIGLLGLPLISDMRHDTILTFLAELGVVILLFQIGLESNVKGILSAGSTSLAIAFIGAAAPLFAGGLWLGPWLFPDSSTIAHWFLGAAMMATSVGISSIVFQQLQATKTKLFQCILGAAVIDDVLGLIALSIISTMATGTNPTLTDISLTIATSIGFIIGAIIIGQFTASPISHLLARINTGSGMKVGFALSFAFLYAYVASLFGLAPIIGAFAAGLVLDPVHFDSYELPAYAKDLKRLKIVSADLANQISKLISKHTHRHVEDLVNHIGYLFIPLFFIFTGLQVDATSLMNTSVYGIALIITLVAIITKLVAGFAYPGTIKHKLAVGASMVPRGEVGLIFAAIGNELGVLTPTMFSTIIIVIIATTLMGPLLIKQLVPQLKE